MENKLEKKISRRAFLSNTGKIVGVGVLTHFAMIGKAADDLSDMAMGLERATCGAATTNSCEAPNKYTCSAATAHTCGNKFSCGTFTCSPAASNNCTTSVNNCNPVATFKPE